MGFKEKLARFMYGRYGTDELYRFLTIAFYVIFFLNIFLGSVVLYGLTLGILIFATYRTFSKNILRRREENMKYLSIKRKVTDFFKLQKNKWRDRKTHVYKKCPHCRAVLRLPKSRGKHSVRCPGCSNSFDVKI